MRNCLNLLFLISLTGCCTIQRMNDLVNDSTIAIDANRQIVERNTMMVRENAALVDASTRALQENQRELEEASKH